MTDPASQYPLLIFAQTTRVEREPLGGGPGRGFTRRPTARDQERRLGTKWSAIEQALANRTAALASDLLGVDPELVLVFEIVGDVEDFYRAVRQIEGFEYLAEYDETDVDGDGAFVIGDDESELLDGTLFLLASNQTALAEVLELWNTYVDDETASFPYGLGRWKSVFGLLKDVRRWSARDRLRGTGVLEDFTERRAAGMETVPAEIELWFRESEDRRSRAEQIVRRLVTNAGGQVLASAAISEIAYHAILVRLPIASVEPLLADNPQTIELVRADAIAFVRPEAQAVVTLEAAETVGEAFPVDSPPPESQLPFVAMLDGIPLVGHELLSNRINLDDPDGWEADVEALQRQHGTAIASLIVHGDGEDNQDESLRRRVYSRPVLIPEDGTGRECIPHDQLAVDLVHRAVVRIVDEEVGGIAPSVRVINLSLGDTNVQLAGSMSPWARLLDWLAYRYKILFVISAGNHMRRLVYDMGSEEFRGLEPHELRAATFKLLVEDAQRRRLLSPAEAMNCLCVGAAHIDYCENWIQGARHDLIPSDDSASGSYPSPVTAIGMGYKRSVKPDLLAPGGRLLFRTLPSGTNPPKVVANPIPGTLPPGLAVATPSAQVGALDGTRYFHGTSGAAALVTHYCGLLLEEFEELTDPQGRHIDPEYYAILAKTLLVHTTRLPSSADEIRGAFGEMSTDRLKDSVSRFYGYGLVRPERAMHCVKTRATALGWGTLGDDEAEIFEFPLPPCLSGKTLLRRVAVTAAYFSPIRNRDRRHRAAQLFIKPRMDALQVRRSDADWRTVRRGTVQHEVFDGQRAAAFVEGDVLAVQVNCRSLVGRLADPVQYGLAVTLEVAATADLPVYAQVAERIRLQARARVQGS